MSKMAKREGPADVDPVSVGGIRFEALHWGKKEGLDQNGGYIVAIDPKSEERLWTLKIYDVVYDPERESDVQDVFITRLRKTLFGGKLKVYDEDNRVFVVNPGNKSVYQN